MVGCGTLALRIKTHGDWLRLDQLIALGLSEFKSGWLPDVQEDVVPSRVDAMLNCLPRREPKRSIC